MAAHILSFQSILANYLPSTFDDFYFRYNPPRLITEYLTEVPIHEKLPKFSDSSCSTESLINKIDCINFKTCDFDLLRSVRNCLKTCYKKLFFPLLREISTDDCIHNYSSLINRSINLDSFNGTCYPEEFVALTSSCRSIRKMDIELVDSTETGASIVEKLLSLTKLVSLHWHDAQGRRSLESPDEVESPSKRLQALSRIPALTALTLGPHLSPVSEAAPSLTTLTSLPHLSSLTLIDWNANKKNREVLKPLNKITYLKLVNCTNYQLYILPIAHQITKLFIKANSNSPKTRVDLSFLRQTLNLKQFKLSLNHDMSLKILEDCLRYRGRNLEFAEFETSYWVEHRRLLPGIVENMLEREFPPSFTLCLKLDYHFIDQIEEEIKERVEDQTRDYSIIERNEPNEHLKILIKQEFVELLI